MSRATPEVTDLGPTDGRLLGLERDYLTRGAEMLGVGNLLESALEESFRRS
jgi:hypothetical protein